MVLRARSDLSTPYRREAWGQAMTLGGRWPGGPLGGTERSPEAYRPPSTLRVPPRRKLVKHAACHELTRRKRSNHAHAVCAKSGRSCHSE